MTLLCVIPPQKCIFCDAEFGSTIALDLQQKLKPFLHSSQKQQYCFLSEFCSVWRSCVVANVLSLED